MNSSDMGGLSINGDQKARLIGLWDAAKGGTPPNITPQFLIAGVNVRFHLGHAMKAVLETAKASVSVGRVLHNPFEVWELVDCAAEIGAALMSVFEALIQTMSAIDYVTSVVLAEHIPAGITQKALQERVAEFLNHPKSDEYSWHLGMSRGRLDEAKKAIEDEDWFEETLEELRKLGFVKDEPISGKLMFESIGFEVGMKQVIGG